MKYNPLIVLKFFRECGIPDPMFEYRFHPKRKFRFDIAWPEQRLYLEVDGGIWVVGGHNRGAQMLKDWEKRNEATILGWRGLWCEPKSLCTEETVDFIRRALCRTPTTLTS